MERMAANSTWFTLLHHGFGRRSWRAAPRPRQVPEVKPCAPRLRQRRHIGDQRHAGFLEMPSSLRPMLCTILDSVAACRSSAPGLACHRVLDRLHTALVVGNVHPFGASDAGQLHEMGALPAR